MNETLTCLKDPSPPWTQTFCWEQEPVLLCTLSLPQFDRPVKRAERRIAAYYAHLARWLRTLWEHQAFPTACAALQAARDASLPFRPYREEVTFQITRNGGEKFSLYWDSAWETGASRGLARWGDTWDLGTGCPLSMTDLLPPRSDCRHTLPALAEQQAAERIAAGTSLYYPNYAELLRTKFDSKRFYIDEDSLFFFYPPGTVAPVEEGIPTFHVDV